MKTFGEAEVQRLADILSTGQNTHLKSISASGHALSSSSLEILGKALSSPSASKIQCLAIGDESMGDEGVAAFCMPLCVLNTQLSGGSIESIDLSFKSITDVSTAVIGKTFGWSKYLKRLDLYRNPGIGDEGMIQLCSFSSSQSQSKSDQLDADIDSIVTFPLLEHLDIAENRIGPAGTKALVNCLTKTAGAARTAQIDLQISMNPIGSEGCTHLKDLISKSIVKKISLKKCSIGDEGFQSLVESFQDSSCNGFSELDVSDNGIGAGGIISLSNSLKKHASHFDSFKILNLAKNPIGNDGVMALAGALAQDDPTISTDKNGNSTLETLDLSSTKCGVDGAVETLKCTSLKSVRLFDNNLGSEGFAALTPLLHGGHKTLEHLDLGGNRAKEDAVLALLRAVMVKNEPDNSVLRTIELGGNEVGDKVEELVKEMMIVRPELDIARDRPSVDQPEELQEGDSKI